MKKGTKKSRPGAGTPKRRNDVDLQWPTAQHISIIAYPAQNASPTWKEMCYRAF